MKRDMRNLVGRSIGYFGKVVSVEWMKLGGRIWVGLILVGLMLCDINLKWGMCKVECFCGI